MDLTNESKKNKDKTDVSKPIQMHKALYVALKHNKVDDVRTELTNLKNEKVCFIKQNTLNKLYKQVLGKSEEPIAQLIKNTIGYIKQSMVSWILCRDTGDGFRELADISKLLQHLLQDESLNSYTGIQSNLSIATIRRITEVVVIDRGSLTTGHTDMAQAITMHDLFIWATLTNKRELSRVLWRFGTRQLGAVLIGCALLKALAEKADSYGELELTQDLKNHAIMYEDMAVGSIGVCYNDNKTHAHNLLVRRMSDFGDKTLFSISNSYSIMAFMDTSCCQTKLNLLWKGRMAPYTPTWKMILCAFLPIFILPCIRFPTRKLRQECKPRTQDGKQEETVNSEPPNHRHTTQDGKQEETVNSEPPNHRHTTQDGKQEETVNSEPPNHRHTTQDGKQEETVNSEPPNHRHTTQDGKQEETVNSEPPNHRHTTQDGKQEETVNSEPPNHRHTTQDEKQEETVNSEPPNHRHTTKDGKQEETIWSRTGEKIIHFYESPIIIFITYTFSYMVFLGIFTLFVLTDLHPGKMSVYEMITWVWTFSLLLEEIRQILCTNGRSLWYKLRGYFDSAWNQFDLIICLLFLVAGIVRHCVDDDDFVWARSLYSFSLATFIFRTMQHFLVHKEIGPKVIVLRNMLKDVLLFIGIFVVFLLSFGVMYQANLYPNAPQTWGLVISIVSVPYWQIYGELFLDEVRGEIDDGCTMNETLWRQADGLTRCPEHHHLVPYLAAMYLLMSNIILVNLLIAMFSTTYQKVHDQSELIWRYYRYDVVHTLYHYPLLCPPLNILALVYRMVHVLRTRNSIKVESRNEFSRTFNGHSEQDKKEKKDLDDAEKEAGVKYLKQLEEPEDRSGRPESSQNCHNHRPPYCGCGFPFGPSSMLTSLLLRNPENYGY